MTAPDRLTSLSTHLREIAENASAGPWSYGDIESVAGGTVYNTVQMVAGMIYDSEPFESTIRPCRLRDEADRDGAFIAALNPTVALALADVIDGIARQHVMSPGGEWCTNCYDEDGHRTLWPCFDVERVYPLADLLLGETK